MPADMGIHRRQGVIQQIHVCSAAGEMNTSVKTAFHRAACNSRLLCIDTSDHHCQWHRTHGQRTRSGVAGTR